MFAGDVHQYAITSSKAAKSAAWEAATAGVSLLGALMAGIARAELLLFGPADGAEAGHRLCSFALALLKLFIELVLSSDVVGPGICCFGRPYCCLIKKEARFAWLLFLFRRCWTHLMGSDQAADMWS